ncbi:MAG: NAD(P)/FAD-dependent oxidoreductase [Alphaproteobacteria bacterium]|nr:NAD(P)/FAD-dependent oxidoreductase [Alphaproteobacteria bacterium]
MSQPQARRNCEVAIIGAGPYGLSLAAHLAASNVSFRIFGRPMELWRHHMPEKMMLKSNGYASNLSAPDGKASSLKSFCRQTGRPYGDLNVPVPVQTFIDYADWFRARHVPQLDQRMVTGLDRDEQGYILTLEDGEQCHAAQVVMAVGITNFPHMPAALKDLPGHLASHSFDHRNVDHFAGKQTVVLGAGASAVNLAYELHEAGADVTMLARDPVIEYHDLPHPKAQSLWQRLVNPPAPFGQGWRSLLVARLPQLFYHLPRHLRQRAIKSHMKPAAGWFMRGKIMGKVPEIVGQGIANAWEEDGKVHLTLSGGRKLICDHVFASTGYRVDLNRLSFLAPSIRHAITHPGCALQLSSSFETDLPGLYALGAMAMENFGPLLHFVCGTPFATKRLARVLKRRVLLAQIEEGLRGVTRAAAQKLQEAFA